MREPASACQPARWEDVRNIGPRSAGMLRAAGLETPDDLARLGPVAVYARIAEQQSGVSLNLLWALAGAWHHCHWAALDADVREGLLRELDARQDIEGGVRGCE